MDLPSIESVRASVLETFRSLSPEERSRRSALIASGFLAQSRRGKRIALYRSLKSEVELLPLERGLLEQGAELCYPRITDSANSSMCFVQVEDPSHPDSWERGPYGEGEPGSHHPEVEAPDIDIVIVPGLAFGRSGERIGRGKGYYDRYLAKAPQCTKIALAFDFQLFQALRQNPWDQKVQRILTDTEEVVIQ